MDIQAQDLHHYGIISGICNEIGLVDQIDAITKSDPQRKISVGECVKAMVINGMGYTTRPLYLAHQFYESKPLCHLIKPGIKPSDLNDDALGRALDSLYENDCTKIFFNVALNAAKLYEISQKFHHLDTTHMQVHGEYADEDQATKLVNFGYPKHGRPDLKQFLISLIVSNDSGIPLMQHTIPGNTSDNAHFREVLKTMQDNMIGSNARYTIADAAFYSEENVQLGLLWLSRVPDKIKLVGQLKEHFADLKKMITIDEDYKYAEVGAWYGNVNQRWLIVHSEMAHQRAQKAVDRQVKKEKEETEKAIKKAQSEAYACPSDAQNIIAALSKKLDYHEIHIVAITERKNFTRAGRPTKNTPIKIEYHAQLALREKTDEISKSISLKSMFVLATNELNSAQLSNIEILSVYKDQYKVESGFRFLKDPLCLASAVYLKNTKRIIALSMIMCLCLLVYALAERKLRKALVDAHETIPNQVGKPTQTPTMKWVFQMFEGVIIAYIPGPSGIKEIIINLSEKLQKILRLLGDSCMQMYLMPPGPPMTIHAPL